MKDTQLFKLNKNWALAYDQNQWIIQKLRFVHSKTGEERWDAKKFIGTNKENLMRAIKECGVKPNIDAVEALEALPATFYQFLAEEAPTAFISALAHKSGYNDPNR